MAWQICLPNYKKGRAPRTARDFWPFPWEKAEEEQRLKEMADRFQPVTPEQNEGLNKMLEKINAKDNE